jgi:hypothetical protein
VNKPTPIGASHIYFQPRLQRGGWRSFALTAVKHSESNKQCNAERRKSKNVSKPALMPPTNPTVWNRFASLILISKTESQHNRATLYPSKETS